MTEPGDEHFLVLAPTGRDAALTAALLGRAGIACLPCKNVQEMCSRLEATGAAGLLIAEEVLARKALARLKRVLQGQEAWSDVPIVVFTAKPATQALVFPEPSDRDLLALGNVTLLERPLRPITMLSAVNAALRARRRQYALRAELQAQQQAVLQRDQFLAMLGHELRNPLAAITLALRLEEEESSGSRQGVIRHQVQHLSRLVDELLDATRVTSGKITLRIEALDLVPLARRCADALEPSFEAQQLRMKLCLPDEPVIVDGDAVRLEQVVNNLLTNAAKYTPGGGHIRMYLSCDGADALLQIEDSGVGIGADMIERVFDLFAQAEASLDRSKGGLGIGLTLTRRLVELHGGRIAALSDGIDRGSTFEVRLPLANGRRSEPIRTGPASERPRADARRHQVLVVEDNADSRELLSLLLERLGHEVFTAEDGLTGVEVALDKRPDVLLVDIGLPGLDGYGVAQEVRRARGSEVYIVALTGYGQPEDRQRALEAGFDAHYTKPLDMHALDNLLNQPVQLNGAA